MNIEPIKLICQRFRIVLENAQDKPEYLLEFPRGWCGYVSRALGVYLLKSGYQGVNYVLGYKGGRSHAWLEFNGLIIDITADQFDDCNVIVFVVKKSTYHENFSNIEKRLISPRDADEYPESWILKKVTENVIK